MPHALIEVFPRNDQSCCITVEPRTALEGVYKYLQNQSAEVSVKPADVAGDLTINLLNGKTMAQVLEGAGTVVEWHMPDSQ